MIQEKDPVEVWVLTRDSQSHSSLSFLQVSAITNGWISFDVSSHHILGFEEKSSLTLLALFLPQCLSLLPFTPIPKLSVMIPPRGSYRWESHVPCLSSYSGPLPSGLGLDFLSHGSFTSFISRFLFNSQFYSLEAALDQAGLIEFYLLKFLFPPAPRIVL